MVKQNLFVLDVFQLLFMGKKILLKIKKMLNIKEFEELKFFARKVAEVHGPEHGEFIEINAVVEEINEDKIDEINFEKLRELSNDYTIPEGACNAQTTLLNLLKKLDNK